MSSSLASLNSAGGYTHAAAPSSLLEQPTPSSSASLLLLASASRASSASTGSITSVSPLGPFFETLGPLGWGLLLAASLLALAALMCVGMAIYMSLSSGTRAAGGSGRACGPMRTRDRAGYTEGSCRAGRGSYARVMRDAEEEGEEGDEDEAMVISSVGTREEFSAAPPRRGVGQQMGLRGHPHHPRTKRAGLIREGQVVMHMDAATGVERPATVLRVMPGGCYTILVEGVEVDVAD